MIVADKLIQLNADSFILEISYGIPQTSGTYAYNPNKWDEVLTRKDNLW